MPAVNENLKSELDRFKDLKGDPFYALQIDAPWGSGKTYFITNYLTSVYPDVLGEARPYLHITLFGIQSTGDIEKQILGQLFSGGERLAGSLLSSALSIGAAWIKADKAYSETAEKTRLATVAKELKRIKAGMVVFDDVERCSMPLKDALGYINQFIERDKFKVIIISNEKALQREEASEEEKKNSRALAAFKEKLIGRTLGFEADPDSAYDEFTNVFKSTIAKDVSVAEKKSAIALFRASKRGNLRSLRIGLEAFDRMLDLIGATIPQRPEGLKEIFLACIYIALENGAAVKQVLIADPQRGRLSRLMRGIGGAKEDKPGEDEIAATDIIERYSDFLNMRNPTIPFELLLDFIANGSFRRDEVVHAISISPSMNKPSDVPLWRKLIEVWDYNVTDFVANTSELATRFSQLEITDPGELLHLAGILLWREKFGDLALSGGAPPEEFIVDYLSRLKSAGKQVDIKLKLFQMDRLSAYGYSAIAPDEMRDRLILAVDAIKASMDEAATSMYPAVYKEVVKSLSSDERDFDALASEELQPYVQMPFFTAGNVSEFADLMMRQGRFDAHILKWLSSRYDYSGAGSLRAKEQTWIDNLYVELERRIVSLPNPLDKWWGLILDNNLKRHVVQLAPAAAAVGMAGASTSAPQSVTSVTQSPGASGTSTI